MRISLVSVVLATSALGLASLISPLQAEETRSWPDFSEVYGLVKSNLVGASLADLNQDAVRGLLSQLQSRVKLVTNGVPSTDASAPLVSRAKILDDSYAWLQIGRVAPGLAQAVTGAYEPLHATNALKGIVVDLRYGVGIDYATAAETADLFFKTEQALLKWGETSARSTAKSNAIDLPMVVLVNGQTSGAAEALAATLRQAEGAVLIGSPTAGEAYLFKEFQLSNGESLRIANGSVTVGNGDNLSDRGVIPDIRVAIQPDDEKKYFQDPYQMPPKSLARTERAGAREVVSSGASNRPPHRLNEADLVRMQREGEDFDVAQVPAATVTPTLGPVITDPVLSRALDILKGLALALKRR